MRKKTETPIKDFIAAYVNSGICRFHMPGHKGRGTLGAEVYDITEVVGADSLYSPSGIIARSEEIASEIFGARTHYSTEGSSHAIRAMVYLATLRASESGAVGRILAGRNAHKTFLSAAALMDVKVDWIPTVGSESYLSCAIDKDGLDRMLSQDSGYAAVYITTPDYLGGVLDVSEISRITHKYGIPLLVDNAHGAYLKFLTESLHPMDLGADMCADSAHKTLPVLTGGAYLHISKDAPRVFLERAVDALSLFGSTSPSYLTLQSLDAANAYLADGYREELCEFCHTVSVIKQRLSDFGYTIVYTEPLKITIASKSVGYTGYELADILRQNRIECEFSDPDYLVLMLTPSLDGCELDSLLRALTSVERKAPITDTPPCVKHTRAVMSPREAVLSSSERIPAGESVGRILASLTVSCPPAVPIVTLGERIDESAVNAFRYYGIDEVTVVKE